MVRMVIDCLVHLRGAGGEFCSRCGGGLCQEIPALICAIESFCADRMTIMKMITRILSELEVAPRHRLLSLLREALKKIVLFRNDSETGAGWHKVRELTNRVHR